MTKSVESDTAPAKNAGGSYKPKSYDTNALIARYKAWWPCADGETGPEADAARLKREKNASQLCIDYYDLVSPAYERGWGKQFHYCPMLPGRTIEESLVEYEISIGKSIGLKDGMKVLDVGCGIAGPARTMAKRFGCKVTGLINSAWHVERGTQLNKEAGLEELIEIVEGDYHHMPFAENTFDAVYSFEAICYAPDVTIPYREILRVLKPGGMFGYTDWVMTENFDPSIERHRRIRDQIERGNGIARMPLISDIRTSLRDSGFDITFEEQMDNRSKAGEWYYPLLGRIKHTTCRKDFFRTLALEPKLVLPLIDLWYKFLVAIRVAPSGLPAAFDVMKACTGGVANGGVEGIFTPLAVFVARSTKGELES